MFIKHGYNGLILMEKLINMMKYHLNIKPSLKTTTSLTTLTPKKNNSQQVSINSQTYQMLNSQPYKKINSLKKLKLKNQQKSIMKSQHQQIGDQKEQSLQLKTKVNVVLVGHSQQPVPQKVLTSLKMVTYYHFLNNNWLIVLDHMVIKVVMVV